MSRREFCRHSPGALAIASAIGSQDALRRRVNEPVDGTYAQSHEISGVSRWLFISGQVPSAADGSIPPTFREQCRSVWTNVFRQLQVAGMRYDNLVKVTVFLADRRYRHEAREVRQEMLGRLQRPPALTVVIVDIYEDAWLVEIEAIAAA